MLWSRLEPITSFIYEGWYESNASYLLLLWHQEEFLALPTEQRHWPPPPALLVLQSCAVNTVAMHNGGR
jgi:hypothetical protein